MAERMSGEKNPAWKGGVKPESLRIRHSREMQEWRQKVFERDNYTCQECGARSHKGLGHAVKLEAHHIKPFSDFPEERFNIENGETLCVFCHNKTKGRRKKNSLLSESLSEFNLLTISIDLV
jgi:5-methylcytosine-specific restriction endonuclease McrA